MPLLDDKQLAHMRSLPAQKCRQCRQETYTNYCRACDEFYDDGHTSNCPAVSADNHNDHRGHRTY
jgi:hypothetical protein